MNNYECKSVAIREGKLSDAGVHHGSRYNRKQWLNIVLFFTLSFLILSKLSACTQARTLDRVNLDEIIAFPREIKQHNNDEICREIIDRFSVRNVETEATGHNFGLLPVGNQLQQKSIVAGCIRNSIAVYPDSFSADLTFQRWYDALVEFEATELTLYESNSTVLFVTPLELIIGPRTYESNIWFFLTKECNTIVAFFAIIKDEYRDPNTTFGMSLDRDEMISYMEQIQGRIDRIICPIVANN